MSSYADLYKPIKSLLESNYGKDSLSFSTKAKVNPTLSLDFNATQKKDTVEGSLSWTGKHVFDVAHVSITGKLFNNGNLSLSEETSFKEQGVTVKVGGNLLAGPDAVDLKEIEDEEEKEFRDSMSAELLYENKKFRGSLLFNAKRKNAVKVGVTGATDYEGFVVGGQVNFEPEKGYSTTNFSLVGGFSKDKLQVRVGVDGKNKPSFEKVKLGVRLDFSSDLSGAVEFKHDLPKQETSFSFGSEYSVDRDQTLKIKVDNKLKTKMAYIVNLNKDLKMNLSVDTDLKALRGVSSTTEVFVGFTFEQK